ncbi:MAG: hypothetical protein PHV73_06075, partial [Eubacteriales bacterium]|nr:hypothetical protein [Eubacteriales bacterium]
MDNLHSYINNMFADFPEGPNKENLKYRVLRESEDRYRALQAEGHSDAEALGLVIQELDADEIRRRFDAEESTYRDYATRGFGDNPAADYARKFENKQRVRTILSTMLWPVTT